MFLILIEKIIYFVGNDRHAFSVHDASHACGCCVSLWTSNHVITSLKFPSSLSSDVTVIRGFIIHYPLSQWHNVCHFSSHLSYKLWFLNWGTAKQEHLHWVRPPGHFCWITSECITSSHQFLFGTLISCHVLWHCLYQHPPSPCSCHLAVGLIHPMLN
jgi:hypothetical protein